MEKSKAEPTLVDKPRMGRPPVAEPKKSIELILEGDYVVIKVPRKDLTKKLLAELI